MYRFMGVVFLVLLPLDVCGQGFNPYEPIVTVPDARARRAARERMVSLMGVPSARAFIEAYGEDAVAALATCSKPMGQRLCDFHQAGGVEKWAQPVGILRAIAQHKPGDDILAYAIRSVNLLRDPDMCAAFLVGPPLEYALNLRSSLADRAAGVRASRLSVKGGSDVVTFNFSKSTLFGAGAIGFVALVYLVVRYRQKAGPVTG